MTFEIENENTRCTRRNEFPTGGYLSANEYSVNVCIMEKENLHHLLPQHLSSATNVVFIICMMIVFQKGTGSLLYIGIGAHNTSAGIIQTEMLFTLA